MSYFKIALVLMLICSSGSYYSQSSYTVYYKPQGSYVPPAYTKYYPPYTPPRRDSYNSNNYNSYKSYSPPSNNYNSNNNYNNNSNYNSRKPNSYSPYTSPSYHSSTPSYTKPVDPADRYLYGNDLNTENLAKSFVEMYNAKEYSSAEYFIDKIALSNLKKPSNFASMVLYCYLHNENYKGGVSYFERNVEKSYSSEVDNGLIGDLYFEINNYKKAINFYNKVYIKDIKTNQNLASSYYSTEDRYNAAIYFENYFKAGGKDPWLRILLGFCYYERYTKSKLDLDYNKAMEALNISIASGSNFPEAHLYRADLFLFKYKSKEALSDIKKADELGYNDDVILIYYSAANYQLKEYKISIGYIDRYLKVKPNSADALNRRAKLKALLNDYSSSLVDINKALSINSTEGNYYDTRAFIYLNSNAYTLSIEDYSKAIAYGLEEDASVYYFRGMAYHKSGKLQSACSDWSKSEEIGLESLLVDEDAARLAISSFCK